MFLPKVSTPKGTSGEPERVVDMGGRGSWEGSPASSSDPCLFESYGEWLEAERQGAQVTVVTNPRYWEDLGKMIGENIEGSTIAFDEYTIMPYEFLNGKQLYRTWRWDERGKE